MRVSKSYLIAAAPLFVLAQVPAFVSWTMYVGPWDHGLLDAPSQKWVFILSALVVGLGAVAFAVGTLVAWGATTAKRRLSGGPSVEGARTPLAITVAALSLSFIAAAGVEFALVSLLKMG